jgi:phosphoribosylformylglycinamidine synthase II
MLDTVLRAAADPETTLPYAETGLQAEEYARIRTILGRRPSATELAMYAVMWSEHCSYKSSKIHLRRLAETARGATGMLAGIGENAGVVDVGDGLAVTFKVESHNHPSFVEPYQGAATGVGGIVRDILTMGARPVAVMDSLRFGPADAPDTARLVRGVVGGVGGYGNCLGLPNIGGEVGFDPSYAGNPLVNALCVGVLPTDRLQKARAVGVGNSVVLLGAKTGRDGIGGVSVLASASFDATGAPAKRPSVQVGDPFTEKLLIECCLELFERKLIVGIQDLGGAGLTCALSETASAAGTGMSVQLDRVPLREASMQPLEVLTSESQERMLAIVEPGRLAAVQETCRRWGVLATAIGTVTDTGRLVVEWHGEQVVDAPPASLADDGPVYHRPLVEPPDLAARQADAPTGRRLARPESGAELADAVSALAGSANLCSRRWVTEQYDRYVLGATVLAPPADAGMIRLTDSGARGIALSLDGNGRYARLDPYRGAQLALSEAYRNVAVTGARPIAATNCLNFGSPEDPHVMWTFAEAVAGLADGCGELALPITGGNVSFYNQTGDIPVHPTPVIGVLGLIADVTTRLPLAPAPGDVLYLLGETREELGGSEWAWVTHGHLGGRPPVPDFAAERALGEFCAAAAAEGLASAAHDLSDGGLAQCLVECALAAGCGIRVALPGAAEAFVELFSESVARAVVAAPPGRPVAEAAERAGIACRRLGEVGGADFEVIGRFTIPLAELAAVHEAGLPGLFG